MIWIGLVIGVFIYACRKEYSFACEYREKFNIADVLISCLFPLLFVFTLFLLTHIWVDNSLNVNYELEESTPIYALQDGVSFVSCTNNSGGSSVAYLIESEDGKSIKTTSSDKTFFVESSDAPPRVDIYKAHLAENWQYLFFNNDLLSMLSDKKYVFTVPPGSISVNYQVDLK